MTHPIHIIAEAGTNHGGNEENARQLIAVAAAARADSVKFQLIYPEGLYLPRFYRADKYEDNQVFKLRAAAMLPDQAYRRLADYSRQTRIPLSASVFDRRGLDLLDELDAPYIKIASCDLNNSPLLRAAAARGRTLIVSTGMASLDEIERAVDDIRATGNARLVLMHCVSVYPSSLAEMNLSFLTTLRRRFGCPVGLSDHTETNLAAVMAVALGVEWIEKHFTLNRAALGFDHAYAMEPAALRQFVQDIRDSEQALSASALKVGAKEALTRGRARRALYAARNLVPGEVLTEQDVLIVRPEGPMQPNDVGKLIGKALQRPVRQYEALTPDAVAA